jgi:FkbM family methyltransferase
MALGVHLLQLLLFAHAFGVFARVHGVFEVSESNVPFPEAKRNVATFLRSLPGKGVTSLHIDVGASLDPLVPPAWNHSVGVLAFEPVRYAALVNDSANVHNADGNRLHISPAAISNVDGEQTMGIFNKYGASSSLSKSVNKFVSRSKDPHGARKYTITVPVLSLRGVLEAVPDSVDIWFLKTDMQGYDFMALHGAGDALKRVRFMKTEVWIHNEQFYEDVNNDFCNDFLPLLVPLGFELVELARDTGRALASGPAGGREFCEKQVASKVALHRSTSRYAYDAYWMRRDLIPLWNPPFVSQRAEGKIVQYMMAPFGRLVARGILAKTNTSMSKQ